MPSLIILVGLPATGKTTYVEEVRAQSQWEWTVVSSDNVIEKYAARDGISYDDAFNKYKKIATKEFWQDLEEAAKRGENIFVDRTNLTVELRSKIISIVKRIDLTYDVGAVTFHVCDDGSGTKISRCVDRDEWYRRLKSRVGKTIPDSVLDSMAASNVLPTLNEGFDWVV